MQRALLVFVLLAASGCTSLSVGPHGVEAHGRISSNSVATLIALGYLAGAAVEDARHPRPFPSLRHSLSGWTRYEPPPPLAEERRIHTQDCSKPPEDPYANLRCR